MALLALTILVIVPMAGPAAATEGAAPIKVDPVSIVLDAKGSGSTTVENDLGVKLSVAARPDGLGPSASITVSAGDPSVPAATGVSPIFTIPAGSKATLTVDAAVAELTPKPEVSLIVKRVYGLPAGSVLRIPVLTKALSPANPSVKAWTMIGRFVPWSKRDEVKATKIPLDNQGGCASVDLGSKEPVGTLQVDGRYVNVTAKCVGEGASLFAELSISNAVNQGLEYKGSIDLNPASDTKGSVDLTYRRTAKLWWFIVLLFVGLVIAYVVRWWTGSASKVTQLARRVERLNWAVHAKNPNNVVKQFQDIVEKQQIVGTPGEWDIAAGVHQETAEIDGRLKGLRTLWRPSGASSAEFKAADASLTAAETTVKGWPEVANKLATLQGVMGRLESLPAISNAVKSATFARSEKLVKVEDVASIEGRIKLGVDAATVWPAEAMPLVLEQYLRLRAITGNDDELFRQKRAEAEQAWDRAETDRKQAADLDAVVRARDEFNAAKAAIAVGLAVNDEQLDTERLELWQQRAGEGPPATLPPHESVITPFEQPKRTRLLQWVLDRLVFLALLFAVVLGGYVALFKGKVYGGMGDYLVTIAWGLGAGALLEPLVGLIDSAAERSSFSLDAIP